MINGKCTCISTHIRGWQNGKLEVLLKETAIWVGKLLEKVCTVPQQTEGMRHSECRNS